MKLTKLFVGAFALSAMLVACDSDSTSAKDTEIEELSSSSAVEIASTSSSSWQALSSSLRNDSSSSSVMETSSSSETTQSSSSTATTTLCSELPEGVCNYGTLTDTRDGKTYKTVTIGDQTWMAENLNYAYTGVPYNYSGNTSDSTSWCNDNDPANCAKYGRLYTWAAAIDSVKLATDAENPLDCGYEKECGLAGKVQGICPEGWHLPDTTEWKTLFTAVGGSSTAGAKLKSQTGWTAYDGITNEDSFGFSALPAGYRNYYGSYLYEGDYAYFWSSTEYNSHDAYYMYLYYYGGYAYLYNYDKGYGHSVRCVKD